MEKRTVGGVLSSALGLSGCTALLRPDEQSGKKPEERPAGSDRILAFAAVKTDTKVLHKDELVMTGERYWYVLEQSSATDALTKALQLPVKKPYAFTPVPIEVVQRQGSQYFSVPNICLSYTPENSPAAEAERIAYLQQFSNFRLQDGKYTVCYNLRGRLFERPPQIPADYRFETPIPVTLTQLVYCNGQQAAARLKMMATPFTLLINAAVTPIVVAGMSVSDAVNS